VGSSEEARGVGVKYRVEFLASAEKEFLRLPKGDRQRIGARIDALADNPRPSGCVKMSGYRNLWRIRVGVYRVIYSIEDEPLIVAVTKVAHRRESYRGL
jgi:mRNA interferase RelE/StbE